MPKRPVKSLAGRLRFHHLHLLVELHDKCSIRRAAEATNVTQPAVSKSLKEIEELFGCKLFERSLRGLIPTAQGKVLLRGARMLLNELRHVGEEVDAVAQGSQLTLRIGAPPLIAMAVIPAVLARLHATHGERVRVHLREDTSRALFERLRAGELDALLTRFPGPTEVAEAAWAGLLAHEKLYGEELLVIVPATHPRARQGGIALRELTNERWILPTAASSIRLALDERYQLDGVMPPIPLIESNAMATILRIIGAGLGVGIWPETGARCIRASDGVCLLRVKPRLTLPPVGLFYRQALTAEPAINLLRTAIAGARKDLGVRPASLATA